MEEAAGSVSASVSASATAAAVRTEEVDIEPETAVCLDSIVSLTDSALSLLHRLSLECDSAVRDEEGTKATIINRKEIEILSEALSRHACGSRASFIDAEMVSIPDCVNEKVREYLVENYLTLDGTSGPRKSLLLGDANIRRKIREEARDGGEASSDLHPDLDKLVKKSVRSRRAKRFHRSRVWADVKSLLFFKRGRGHGLYDTTPEVVATLQKLKSWDFDVFRLAELTACPLQCVAATAFIEMSVCEALHIQSHKLGNFLADVSSGYRLNPYHNALHAADVTQALYFILYGEGGFARRVHLRVDLAFAALVAASVHDIDHPGRSNKFLIMKAHPAALTYNDISPLENMHAAIASDLMRKKGNDFLTDSIVAKDKAAMDEFRALIINMVLRTDNEQHGVVVASLLRAVAESRACLDHDRKRQELHNESTWVQRLLVVFLHAADVSNPGRPWGIYQKWLGLIMDEFYQQGDNERELNFPISYGMDRHAPVDMPKFQIGFIAGIVRPLYAEMSELPEVNVTSILEQVDANIAHYEKRA